MSSPRCLHNLHPSHQPRLTDAGSAVDSDADGVTDDIGNICDPDIDADCNVNFADLNVYQANFFAQGDLDTDNNGDGITNFADLNTVKSYIFGPPGPSTAGCN